MGMMPRRLSAAHSGLIFPSSSVVVSLLLLFLVLMVLPPGAGAFRYSTTSRRQGQAAPRAAASIYTASPSMPLVAPPSSRRISSSSRLFAAFEAPKHYAETLPALLPDHAQQLRELRAEVRDKCSFLLAPCQQWSERSTEGLEILRSHGMTGTAAERALLSLGFAPRFPAAVLPGPRGYEESLRRSITPIVFDEQRMTLLSRFMRGFDAPSSSSPSTAQVSAEESCSDTDGMIISGPDGSGKSAIGLMSFLTCFARGIPCMYVPAGVRWSENARNVFEAEKYLLRNYFQLNADLIQDDPRLQPFFSEQAAGGPIEAKNFRALVEAVRCGAAPRAGFIVDDAHKVAEAADKAPIRVAMGRIARNSLTGDVLMKKFLKKMFLSFEDVAGAFQSQLIYGAAGLKKMKLTDADSQRLVYLQPFSKADTKILVSAARGSPFSRMRLGEHAEELLQVTGGHAGDLARFSDAFDPGRSPSEYRRNFARVEKSSIEAKQVRCEHRWYDAMPRSDQLRGLLGCLDAMQTQGCKYTHPNDYHYDYCNSYRNLTSGSVKVVNRLAASAIHSLFAKEYIYFAPPVLGQEPASSSSSSTVTPDLNLKLQMQARIHAPKWEKKLMGRSIDNYDEVKYLNFKADMAYYFESLDDVSISGLYGTLWMPTGASLQAPGKDGVNESLRYDGIILPAEDDVLSPAIIYQTGLDEPWSQARMASLHRLEHVRTQLLDSMPSLSDVIIAAIWPYKRLAKIAIPPLLNATVSSSLPSNVIYTLDVDELMKLKVALTRALPRVKVVKKSPLRTARRLKTPKKIKK